MKYEKMKQQKERKKEEDVSSSDRWLVFIVAACKCSFCNFVTLGFYWTNWRVAVLLFSFFYLFFRGLFHSYHIFFFFFKRSSFLTFSLNRFICSLMRRSEPQIVWWESGFKGLKTDQKHSDVNRWNLNVVTSGCRFIIFTHKLY